MRCLAGLLVLLALPAPAGEVVLVLRQEVLLQQPHITLGVLAEVSADDERVSQVFSAVVLGSAPLAGQIEQRSRADLEQALRSQTLALGQTITWRGAPSVKIRSQSQALDSALLVDVARRQLQQTLGDAATRLEVRLATPLPEVLAPAGKLAYDARLVDASRLRPRMAVWIDVLAQDTVYRSVVVPLAVAAYRSVYVARRMLPAGTEVGPDDFIEREEEVARLVQAPLAPGTLRSGGRVRQTLVAGQVATAQQVAPPDMLIRGDRVRLLLTAGGIEVETVAVAQADGVTGQLVVVRPDSSRDLVTARIIGPGIVRMEQ